jgi:hypothetical protein
MSRNSNFDQEIVQINNSEQSPYHKEKEVKVKVIEYNPAPELSTIERYSLIIRMAIPSILCLIVVQG